MPAHTSSMRRSGFLNREAFRDRRAEDGFGLKHRQTTFRPYRKNRWPPRNRSADPLWVGRGLEIGTKHILYRLTIAAQMS